MRYVLAALGVIFLVILAVVLITRGGGRGPEAPPLVVSEEAREGVSAVYTQEGTVTGEDRRRAIRIVVNQNERRLEVLTGYGEAVDFAQTYPNTHEAFETFLIALDQAGFDSKREAPIGVDERGACPLGRRFTYELNEYSQPLLSLWSTSCGGKLGTFAGSKTTVRKLFELQIPDYRDQVKDVDLKGTKVAAEDENGDNGRSTVPYSAR